MSSPPKKMRKSGGAATTVTLQNELAQNSNDEDLDPAALYEDEEGTNDDFDDLST